MTMQAALAKMRKQLRDAGLDLGRVTGRYPNHTTVPGVNVSRLGASETTVAVHAYPADLRAEAQAEDVLRSHGWQFDGAFVRIR